MTMTRRIIIAAVASVAAISTAFAQSDDFGYELGIEGETKLTKGLKLEFDGSMRTQDDAKKIDRFTVGAAISKRLYQTTDKKFSAKASVGGEWLWTYRLSETDNKYFDADDDLVDDGFFQVGDLKGWNITDSYWRNRLRANIALSANYTPDKRWSFTLKETVQHAHYYTATPSRIKYRVDEYNSEIQDDGSIDWLYSPYIYDDNTYIDNNNLDADGNVIGRSLNQDTDRKNRKDRTILRSKLTVSYDIKGFPVDLFASVDYGCGLNYTANKWKFTAGYDYKLNKMNKVSVYYRYNTEDDDDEQNGHLVGLSYKFEF